MTKSRITIVSVLVWLVLYLLSGMTAHAQSTIRVVEDTNRSKMVSLKGKAEAVFVSENATLFVETSRPSLDTKQKARKNKSGLWEYTIVLQIQTNEGPTLDRTFTITQSGSASKTTFRKGGFEANRRYYFQVEAVKNPIFLVDNTQPTDVHLKNGEAVVEINSMIEVNVNISPQLVCQVEQNHAKAGYYSTSVIINMKTYNELREEVQRHRIIYDDLNESLLERAENNIEVRDSEWYSLQLLQQKKEEAEAQLADVSTIRISAKDSNELSIDISDIQAKNKRIYTVESANRSEKEKVKSNSHWLLLANYAFSNTYQHSFGFTLGWAKQFGLYLSMMTNGSFVMQTDHTLNIKDKGSSQYLWNGKASNTRFLATVGGLYTPSDLGYLYAGVGYGVRNLVWYTIKEQSVCISPGSCRGLALEAGMMFNIKNVILSAGATAQPSGKYYEVKLGLGYQF
jgi:hypothetical protein